MRNPVLYVDTAAVLGDDVPVEPTPTGGSRAVVGPFTPIVTNLSDAQVLAPAGAPVHRAERRLIACAAEAHARAPGGEIVSLSPTAVAVLVLLTQQAHAMSFTDPTPLCTELGLTERGLAEACQELSDAGLIRTSFDGGVLHPTAAGPTEAGIEVARSAQRP